MPLFPWLEPATLATLLALRTPCHYIQNWETICLAGAPEDQTGGGRTRNPAVGEEQLQVVAVFGNNTARPTFYVLKVVGADKHPPYPWTEVE